MRPLLHLTPGRPVCRRGALARRKLLRQWDFSLERQSIAGAAAGPACDVK